MTEQTKNQALFLALFLGCLASIAMPFVAHADSEVDEVLAKFSHEPSIRDTQVAAIKYYNVDPGMIKSLRTRARNKALVPGISAGFVNSVASFNGIVDDIIFRELLADGRGFAKEEQQTADFMGFTISASWALDRLIFNAEELDVMSLIGIQDGLQREVTALYYVRRRLQIELLLNPPNTLEARLSGRLRLEELTGLLDAYTGGFFSKQINRNLKSNKSANRRPRRSGRKAGSLNMRTPE